MRLRDYQLVQAKETLNALHDHQRVLNQAPTGAGKTRLAAWFAALALNHHRRAAFFVHGRDLVYQAHSEFAKAGVSAGIVMADEPYSQMEPIQVCSVDTVYSRLDHMAWLDPAILLFDEAHETMNGTWRAVREKFEGRPEIGFTATPARADGKGLGDVYGAMTKSPDYEWLIQHGRLVRPHYIWDTLSDEEKLRDGGDGYTEPSQEEAFREALLIGKPIEKWKEHAQGRPTVFYAPTVAASRRIAELFAEAGVTAWHIDAHTPHLERERAYAEMREGGLSVLCNYGVLGRGFDMPCVSCVMVMREDKHIASWMQRVGRGLRAYPGKKDCLVIDLGHNVQRHRCFVTDPVDWILDTSRSAEKDRNVRLSDKPKEITCHNCRTVYPWTPDPVCPHCGAVPTKQQREEALPPTRDATVTLYDPKRVSMDEKQEIFGMLLYYVRAHVPAPGKKPWKDNFASVLYREMFGTWPPIKRGTNMRAPNAKVQAFLDNRRKHYHASHRHVDLSDAKVAEEEKAA